jgi:hypothetical protein
MVTGNHPVAMASFSSVVDTWGLAGKTTYPLVRGLPKLAREGISPASDSSEPSGNSLHCCR